MSGQVRHLHYRCFCNIELHIGVEDGEPILHADMLRTKIFKHHALAVQVVQLSE